MNFDEHNRTMVRRATAQVEAIAEAAGTVEPRFTIRYEAFGSGGIGSVTADHAARFLCTLADRAHPNWRYRTKIKVIKVRAEVPTITISL